MDNSDGKRVSLEEEWNSTTTHDAASEETRNEPTSHRRDDTHAMVYGVQDRPPWFSIILMGGQHFAISFSACFALPLIVAGPMCFDLDRDLLNRLVGTVFFITGLTTFLQTCFGTRLPIIQGPSVAFMLPAMVLFGLKGPCPAPLTANSTMEERAEVREIAFERIQELQGSICLASLAQVILGVTGLVGVLLRFVRPITIAITLIFIILPIMPMASDACGTHWGIASMTIFLIILFSQFLDRYQIPLPRGNRFAIFTFFPILLAVAISWIVCLILTEMRVLPDDPDAYGYQARTDIYGDVINDAAWFRVPYPGQFGVPTVSLAGFIGMFSGVIASVVESVGDYHACALISESPPPPVHAINRGVLMEGVGCITAGLWGAPFGYTSWSFNISAISLTKDASRWSAYAAAAFFAFSGIFFKFSAFCVSLPQPIVGGIMATTFGIVCSIGFANLAFVKVNTSRNLFIIGFAIFMGVGLPDFLIKNPEAISTGAPILDQVLKVILGSNMFIGGLSACVLDNLVRGTPEEKGINWRTEMSASYSSRPDKDGSQDEEEENSCYDFPLGMKWIRRTPWLQYLPVSPTFVGFRRRHQQLPRLATDTSSNELSETFRDLSNTEQSVRCRHSPV